jgi:hypothetical protein
MREFQMGKLTARRRKDYLPLEDIRKAQGQRRILRPNL